jgi:hypothetical protein
MRSTLNATLTELWWLPTDRICPTSSEKSTRQALLGKCSVSRRNSGSFRKCWRPFPDYCLPGAGIHITHWPPSRCLGILTSRWQALGVENADLPTCEVLGEGQCLGSGKCDGVDWELVYWPEAPHGPVVAAAIVGSGSGVQPPSERLDTPFGPPSLGDGFPGMDPGLLLMHGEVQARFDQVQVECVDGETVEGTLVDCQSQFGFNYYVAVLRSKPELVVASSASGTSASRNWP